MTTSAIKPEGYQQRQSLCAQQFDAWRHSQVDRRWHHFTVSLQKPFIPLAT
jgi:hypothetical protein